MNLLFWDYLLLAFLTSVGVFQIAAAYANLRGLSFFRKRNYGYLFGALLIVAVLAWFYSLENRNLFGLEGSQQLAVFSLGCFLAFVFTALLATLLRGKAVSSDPQRWGLGALEETTYVRAIKGSLMNLWRGLIRGR